MKRFFLVAALVFMAAAQSIEGQSLEVVSFNIRNSGADDGSNSWQYRRETVARTLNSLSFDLLGVQEALPDQVKWLDKSLKGYSRVGVGRDNGRRQGEMMAIYWSKERFSMLDSGTFWLSETPDKVSFGWDAACRRTVTWVKLRDKQSGRELCFFNTHLDHMGKVAREESIKLIVERVGALAGDCPAVLCGDFNSGVDETIFDPLKCAMNDVRVVAAQTDSRLTFNGFGKSKLKAPIDHIFAKGLTPQIFRTLDNDFGIAYISDHYPILAVFEL